MSTPHNPDIDESPSPPPHQVDAARQPFTSREDVIVTDTNQVATDGGAPRSKHFEAVSLTVARSQTTIHAGPLPDAKTLRDLAKIYPDAPKIIFDNFTAQADHRRDMELRTVKSNINKSILGQCIAGVIAFTGLVGSFIVVGMGHSVVGVTSVMTVIGGTVGVFVLGREAQKRERVEKEVVRTKIAKGEPVEKLESGGRTDD